MEFAARAVRLVDRLPSNQGARHIGGQLLRSGTSPLGRHGEAQAAESAKDFIHKMKVALKELRESLRWLKLIHRVPLLDVLTEVESLMKENDELIRIFVASVQTAEKNAAIVREERGEVYLSAETLRSV